MTDATSDEFNDARLQAETRKLAAERLKLEAEELKLRGEELKFRAEHIKLTREANQFRMSTIIAPFTAAAALIGATIAATVLLLRLTGSL